MLMFLLGSYLTGVAFTFFITTFFVALSGQNGQLWRIIFGPIFWPIAVYYYFKR